MGTNGQPTWSKISMKMDINTWSSIFLKEDHSKMSFIKALNKEEPEDAKLQEPQLVVQGKPKP